MLKLLLAVDGSPAAWRAFDAVALMVRSSARLELILLNVREGLVYPGDLPAFSADEIQTRQTLQQDLLLQQAEAKAQECGLSVRASLRTEGLVAPEIMRVATEHGVDQIVLGTRGLSALGNLLLGSVAQRVVVLATVPVLLVK